MEDMLEGRTGWETGPERICQGLFHNKIVCLGPALSGPPTGCHSPRSQDGPEPGDESTEEGK